jgi:hypothetical protein
LFRHRKSPFRHQFCATRMEVFWTIIMWLNHSIYSCQFSIRAIVPSGH